MITSSNPASETLVDVRELPCREKLSLIFQSWTELPVGSSFVLVNEHDPVPVRRQLEANFPGCCTWEYLKVTDDECRIRVMRLAASPNTAASARPFRCASEAGEDPGVLDVRGLEPPEPMLRILEAVERLAPGGTLTALTERRPVHLLPELEARGIRHESTAQPDGSWVNLLRRG
jgi:uncharacterized protein (DUF2249 family)